MKSTKQIYTFQGQSDGGEILTIIEFKEYAQILTSIGSIVETEGITKWKTSDGYPLKPIDTQTFQIANSSEIIHKI